MNFDLSPSEQEFRHGLRLWLAEHAPREPAVGPLWSDPEMERRRAWQRTLFDGGYAGLAWPREYGGRGATLMEQIVFNEEVARVRAPDPLNRIGLYMAGPTIIVAGNEEQKQRYLRSILNADEIWCQGFSEPNAGTDLASIQTRAVDRDDHYEVSGQKVWTTLARIADWCLLLTRTSTQSPPRFAFTMLLVDMHSPGVSVRPLKDMTGGSQFNEVFFDRVRVPKSHVLGEPGSGWSVAMTTLAHERGTLALSLAMELDMVLEEVIELARERLPMLDPDRRVVFRQRIAELAIEARTLRLNGYRALPNMMRSEDPGPEGAMGRLHWSGINQRLQEIGMDLLGMAALTMTGEPSQVTRRGEQFLAARGQSIAGGTSEILRSTVAERLLGLPRSR
jgi:alkylation response protein AidB-like acyl-CoA dehydrogenase